MRDAHPDATPFSLEQLEMYNARNLTWSTLQNRDRPDAFGLIRHAPELYNGSPCADLNSNLEWQLNPFISELGAYNGGYFSGGVLVILSLILMLGINAKVSDVVMEKKLAGDGGQIEDRGERLDD